MAERQNQRPSGSPFSQGARLGGLLLGLLLGCAGAAANTGDRYPEGKRPEAPRSASDGEVLGAHEQDPADTLEGSLTNEHGAPRSPHAEEPAEEAEQRLDYEECIQAQQAAVKAATAAGTEARKRPVCTPPPGEQKH